MYKDYIDVENSVSIQGRNIPHDTKNQLDILHYVVQHPFNNTCQRMNTYDFITSQKRFILILANACPLQVLIDGSKIYHPYKVVINRNLKNI